jgi:predicted Zn-dependent protease
MSRLPGILLVTILTAGCAATAIRGADREALQNEINVGRSLAARLTKKYGLVRDESITSYLTMLGRSIAARSSRPELTFYVGVLDTDETNAFSCPGGYIFLTKGAILNMNNESELAFVIAHEISHVALQHSGDFRRGGGAVEFVSGVLGGAGGNVVNSAVRQATDQMEEVLLERGRQRSMELDADQAGILLAADLNYDPGAGTAYLSRISSASGTDTLVKTHPPHADRVVLMKRFILENMAGSNSPQDRTERFMQYQSRLRSGNTR